MTIAAGVATLATYTATITYNPNATTTFTDPVKV